MPWLLWGSFCSCLHSDLPTSPNMAQFPSPNMLDGTQYHKALAGRKPRPLKEGKKLCFHVTCLLSTSACPGRGTPSAASHWDPGPRGVLCCAWLPAVWLQHWGHQCPTEGEGPVAGKLGGAQTRKAGDSTDEEREGSSGYHSSAVSPGDRTELQ